MDLLRRKVICPRTRFKLGVLQDIVGVYYLLNILLKCIHDWKMATYLADVCLVMLLKSLFFLLV